jgi:hypothetical protein
VDEDKLFELLSGETDATLRPGIKVTGRVQVNKTNTFVVCCGYLSLLY